MQAKKGRGSDGSSKKVSEELQMQLDVRSMQLSSDDEGKEGKSNMLCTSRWMMEDVKNCCQKGGLGLTSSTVYLGHDVTALNGGEEENKKGRQKAIWANSATVEQIRESQDESLRAGTKLVTIASVVADGTWSSQAIALAPSERYKIRTLAEAVGTRKNSITGLSLRQFQAWWSGTSVCN